MTPYEAAREGAAWARLPGRGLLAVSGPLRQKFLHDILSNDVKSLAPGQGCRAALMDVKGRLLAFLRVLVGKDEVVLEVQNERVYLVEERLEHYRVAAPVRFRKDDAIVLAVFGPQGLQLLRAGLSSANLALEDHVLTAVGGAAIRVARAGDLPAGGVVLHVPAAAAESVEDALVAAGGVPLPRETLDVLRIEDGRIWHGPDVTDENLLHETGLVAEYHSPTKGCYVGQEVIARLEARGAHVNKMMRGFRLAAPVPPGAMITAGGRDLGWVTTAGVSPALGAIAMGRIHRSAAEPGTEVEVAGTPATVARLPLRDRAPV